MEIGILKSKSGTQAEVLHHRHPDADSFGCSGHGPLVVHCRLFATLDPTIRRLPLASGSDALLADTVGFISELPTHLIEAFKVRADPGAFW